MDQDQDVLLPQWPGQSQPGQGRVSELSACASLAAPKPPPLTSAARVRVCLCICAQVAGERVLHSGNPPYLPFCTL